MARPRKLYNLNGFAGLVAERRSKVTGTMAGLYAADQAGIESDPATPWATVCEDHGTCVCHETLAAAKLSFPNPSEWCDACRDKLQEKETKENGDGEPRTG